MILCAKASQEEQEQPGGAPKVHLRRSELLARHLWVHEGLRVCKTALGVQSNLGVQSDLGMQGSSGCAKCFGVCKVLWGCVTPPGAQCSRACVVHIRVFPALGRAAHAAGDGTAAMPAQDLNDPRLGLLLLLRVLLSPLLISCRGERERCCLVLTGSRR